MRDLLPRREPAGAADLAPARLSPELRTTGFFFVQFMSVGAINAFAGIWLSARGLSAEQIGLIYAAPFAVVLALNLIVGRLADHASDWRQVIVAGALTSAVLPVGLVFAQGFWSILTIWTLAATAQMVIIPVADAAAMRLLRRRGGDYGAVRAWSAIGYLAAIVGSGFVLAHFGVAAFLPLLIGLAMLRGLGSLALPRFRAPHAAPAPALAAARLGALFRPWFLVPLAGFALASSTHGVLNAFQGLLWSRQGIATHVIGMLIALSALSETAMYFAFRRFVGRYPARLLILAAALLGVIRWLAMSLAPGVAGLVPLQLLHALTYTMGFLACTHYIADRTSEAIAAQAQSLFTVLTLGTSICAITAFGSLADNWGARAYLASAALATAGALLAALSLRFKPPDR